jgi:hypothetical protein
MKTLERRLDRLEGRLAPQDRKPFLIVLTDAAQKLALDSGRCVQILREAGQPGHDRCLEAGDVPRKVFWCILPSG